MRGLCQNDESPRRVPPATPAALAGNPPHGKNKRASQNASPMNATAASQPSRAPTSSYTLTGREGNDEAARKRSRLDDNTDALTPEVTIKEEPGGSREPESAKQGIEESAGPQEFRLPIDPPLGFPQTLMGKLDDLNRLWCGRSRCSLV